MKKKQKLIAYLTAYSIFLSGCQINSILNKNNNKETTPSATFVQDENITLPIPTVEIIETTNEITKPVIEVQEQNILKVTNETTMYTNNSENSLKICKLDINDKVCKLMTCDNNWSLVRSNKYIGYVCNDNLEYTGEKKNTDYLYTKYNDIVLTTSSLNFRKEPNTNSDIILTFKENTELQVIAKVDNGWLLVKSNGILGFVSGKYTTSLYEKMINMYPNINLNELDVKKIVYCTSNLNMRKGNSTDYDKITTLEMYESIRVIEEYNDWYLIMTNDYNFGFVNKHYTKDLEDIFVVVDLSKQRLYLYNNDEIYYKLLVTTGKDSTPSDKGLYKIYNKERDRYLVGPGYKSFVNYWMPYNRGEGLHDASWRSVFGTDSYHTNGSHGCINIPPSYADDIYNNVKVGTKVLVHK